MIPNTLPVIFILGNTIGGVYYDKDLLKVWHRKGFRTV